MDREDKWVAWWIGGWMGRKEKVKEKWFYLILRIINLQQSVII